MKKITYKLTQSFPHLTGESVTVYISDTNEGFFWALSFDDKETSETLEEKWYGHYEGICRIQSQVNPLVWYMWLTGYYDCGENSIPTERVMAVVDSDWEY